MSDIIVTPDFYDGAPMTSDAMRYASNEMQALFAEMERSGVAPALIQRYADQHNRELERKANKAMVDLFDAADRLELRISNNIKTELGATNQMLVDVIQGLQRQEAAVAELRAEFQSTAEGISDRLDISDRRHAASEQDRAMVRQLLGESQDDRAALHAQFNRLEAKVDKLSSQSDAQTVEDGLQMQQLFADHSEELARHKEVLSHLLEVLRRVNIIGNSSLIDALAEQARIADAAAEAEAGGG
jgi:hypothetical protein